MDIKINRLSPVRLVVLGALMLGAVCAATGAVQKIVIAKDLQQDGREVRQGRKPLVAVVTATYCEYCEMLKHEVFRFLTTDERFLLREIVLDSPRPLLDFEGRQAGHNSFGKAYQVKLTPTVLFLDDNGKELAEPLVGVVTLDFYSYYLDKRVAQATQALSKRLN